MYNFTWTLERFETASKDLLKIKYTYHLTDNDNESMTLY